MLIFISRNKRMDTQPIDSDFLFIIRKPCLARGLVIIKNSDGSITIDDKTYNSINDIVALLNRVKRKDLSKNGKIY